MGPILESTKNHSYLYMTTLYINTQRTNSMSSLSHHTKTIKRNFIVTDSLSINTNALNFNTKINVTTQKFGAKPWENPHQRKTQRNNFIYERNQKFNNLDWYISLQVGYFPITLSLPNLALTTPTTFIF